jgi:hypothetical protein
MAEVRWSLVLDDIGRRAEALKRKKTNADRIRSMSDDMKESEKWLALCDQSCQQKKSFPNCECCDIALEYRYYKQKEQAEEGE